MINTHITALSILKKRIVSLRKLLCFVFAFFCLIFHVNQFVARSPITLTGRGFVLSVLESNSHFFAYSFNAAGFSVAASTCASLGSPCPIGTAAINIGISFVSGFAINILHNSSRLFTRQAPFEDDSLVYRIICSRWQQDCKRLHFVLFGRAR
jgi:hypothetical protein